jgi:hypothetical protein
MSFLTLSTGQRPTGSSEGAFGSQFKIIPNNSKLLAFIQSIQKQGHSNWKIVWEIVQGEYKGQTVWQFLALENQNYPDIADRNKEMFARIFVLCGMQIPEFEPNVHVLAQLERKVLGLKIVQDSYLKDGQPKEVNRVTEVHAPNEFVEEVGIKIEPKAKAQKKTHDYNEVNPPFMDSDISF